MPVIAESDPIELKIENLPVAPPEEPATPIPVDIPNNVLDRHRQFIGKINAVPTCFVRGALTGFSDDEFALHLGIAKIDRYVVDAGNGMFCSKAAVEALSKSLERLKA